jgi:hypothetical protein
MAIISASSISIYCPKISVSVGTIIAGKYIETVQERICLILNNYFTSDTVQLYSTCLFNATTRSIVIEQTSWEEYGFKANDDILIYRSLRNDKIVTIESLSANTCILTSACSVIDESYSTNLKTAVYFSLVQWPVSVVQIAAKMIWYDCDYRDKNPSGLRSRSLGPLSESFGSSDTDDIYGYPKKLVDDLSLFRMARAY